MTDKVLSLMDGFAQAGHDTWRALAEGTLKGGRFEDKLVRRSADGLALGPLFSDRPKTSQINTPTAPHLMGRAWHISPQIDHPDIAHAHRDIMDDLNGGASALTLAIDPAGKTGIAVRNKTDLERLLGDVMADVLPLNLSPSADNFTSAALLANHFKGHAKLSDIQLSLGYAPLRDSPEQISSLAGWVSDHAPHWRALSVNAAAAHNEGASPAQELAFMLAVGCAYIRALLKTQSIETACSLIDIHLASDQDAHQGIVKFRAARLLWAKLLDSFGAKTKTCPVYATTSSRMLATQDPWANLLRLSSASFAAICGGADTVSVLPFTHKLGLATPWARRLSRNIGLMQMEESHLGHVNDPAYGSFMHEKHENLTQALARKSWEIFQDIERRGGWFNPDAQSWFNVQTHEANTRRTEKIASGDILLVGVNHFTKPDVRKAPTLKRPAVPARSGANIDATTFEDAVGQADEGHLLPVPHEQPS